MKFKFVITNLSGGGAEKVLLILAETLVDRGHEVELIIFENLIEYEIYRGIKVTVLTEKLTRGWLGKRIMAFRLKKYIAQSNGADLIVSALPFSNEVACLANLKNHWCRIDNTLGAEIDNLSIRSPQKAKRRLKRYLKMYNKKPLIAISDGMINDLRNIGITSKIIKIYNPFNFKEMHSALEQEDSSIPTKPYVIHVGRFNHQKRHDILLDTWKLVDTQHSLVLLTPFNKELQRMIDDRGLTTSVIIAGFKKNPYPWISHADLLVLSSDHEGFGNVIVEALECKTPVVSTDCPFGPAEILSQLPQCLTPVGNVEKLASKISQCLKNPPSLDCIDLSVYDVNSTITLYESLAKDGDVHDSMS